MVPKGNLPFYMVCIYLFLLTERCLSFPPRFTIIIPQSVHQKYHQHCPITLRSSAAKNDDNNDARNNNNSSSSNVTRTQRLLPNPKRPIWTAIEIKRRETERLLIKELLNGDSAIKQLRRLWFSERGKKIENLMYQAELGIGHPQNWTSAEEILEDLILEDPTYIEPYVRLSKLYCLQGRFMESRNICQHVLTYRPWHYVALETMVAVNLAMDDNQKLLLWASRRLPSPSHGELRKKWVEQAIEDSLRIQQEATTIGGDNNNNDERKQDFDESSWQ